jgi:hypothetical protein
VLCLAPWLLASYNVSIFKYFETLCWIWYVYHYYVGKIIWCVIFWWFYQWPNSSSSHFSCFFKWAWPPFYSSDCYFAFLGCWALISPAIVTHFSTWWSPYYFGCNSTYWNLHFPVADGATRHTSLITRSCPLSSCTFWEPNGIILSLVVDFFGSSPT